MALTERFIHRKLDLDDRAHKVGAVCTCLTVLPYGLPIGLISLTNINKLADR